MELSFCAATPVVTARPIPRRARCRACLEPVERPPETRGAARLLRAPEAIAELAAVALALFRDVLRGDGGGICARYSERVKEHSVWRSRAEQIDALREEVAALFEEARGERNRIAYYDTLAQRCMKVVTAAKQDNLLEVLADAVRDDAITPPPRGSLLDQRVEQEFWLLLEKARNARAQLHQHVDAREVALKAADAVDLAGAQSEAVASRKLVEIRRADLVNIERSKEEARSTLGLLEKEIADNLRQHDEMLAEAALLGEQLAKSRAELEQLRDIAKEYEELKREGNVKVPVAAPEDADASEAQLRRLKKEIAAANDLAKKIVASARDAVKKSEEGDNSAVHSLGEELKKDIVAAENEMKKLQKQQTYRARAKRNSAVRDVLEVAKTENKKDAANGKKKRKKPVRRTKKTPAGSALTGKEQTAEVDDAKKPVQKKPVNESASVVELLDVVSTSKAKNRVETPSKTLELENGVSPPVERKSLDDKSDNDESEDPGELVENMFDEAIVDLLDQPLADDVYVEKVQELVEKAAKEVDVQKQEGDVVEPTVMKSELSEQMGEKGDEGIDEFVDVDDADNLENAKDYSKSTDMKSMDEAMENMSMEDALLFREAIEDFKMMQERDQPKVKADVEEDDVEVDILEIPSDYLLEFLENAEVMGKEDEDEKSLQATEKPEVVEKRNPVQPWRIEVAAEENKTDTKSKAKVEETEFTDVESKLKRYSFVEDVEIEPVEDLKLSSSSFGNEEASELLRVVEESEGVNREGIWLEPKVKEMEAWKMKDDKKSDTPAVTETKETVKNELESVPIQAATTPAAPKPRKGRRRKADVEKEAATRRATNASLIEAQSNQMAAASALRKRAKNTTASKPKEEAETTPQIEATAETESKPVKKRGRARKSVAVATETGEETDTEVVVEKKKRGRPRKTPTKTETTTTAIEDNGVVPVVEKKKRGRPRKSAVTTAPVTEPETAEEKPKRGRKKAATSVTETEIGEEKPKRGRKKKAAAVTAAVATESETEEKPKRTRKKAVAVTDSESGIEEKPKRTRKKAVAVSDLESETEEKPKRGRKKAVTATASESETEVKPKRTRKKAVAASASESETEEKPKRTRKKVSAVTGSESDTEEKPKRKRGQPRKIKAENEEI